MTANPAPDDNPADRPSRDAARMSRRVFLVRNAGLAAALIGGHGFAESAHLAITRHRIEAPGLREPVRVVQLTDIHRSWCVSGGFVRRIVERANALKPDLVALTGDYVTLSSSYADSCAEALSGLRAPLGRFAVLGNHDYQCDKHAGRGLLGAVDVANALDRAGITVLTRPGDLATGRFEDHRARNSNVRLPNGLQIVGLDDAAMGLPNLVAGFRGVDPKAPILALTHNPLFFYAIACWGQLFQCRRCLVLSGHTHGGQVNLPIITRYAILSAFPVIRGWGPGPRSRVCLYVSRGVGTTGIPVRIRSRPEIAVFELTPA
jgi:predicted MPP superfamily phosphohydrolase